MGFFGDPQSLRGFLSREIFANFGIYNPGNWRFSKIWGFLSRGLGIFIPRLGIFIPGLGILENLRIFIAEIGDFQNLGIFIPEIRDFWKYGDFSSPGFFGDGDFLRIGISFRGMGYPTKKPPLITYDKNFVQYETKLNVVISINNTLECIIIWRIESDSQNLTSFLQFSSPTWTKASSKRRDSYIDTRGK